MLKEIFENVAELISGLPEFQGTPARMVKRYHGEFEEGFEWNPVLPCALLYIANSRPQTKAAQSETITTTTQVTIFVAGRLDSLELAEKVANVLDGEDFEISQCNYYVNYLSLEFYGYIRAVEIYKIIVEVK